jgi:hypothetical protein
MAFAASYASSIRRPHAVQADQPLVFVLLFCLFALYGPAFNFAGQLRYAEAAVLLLGLFYYDKFAIRVDWLEWKLSLLFLSTAAVQWFSNYVNDAPSDSTIARVGTYVILAALIPCIAVLVNRRYKRLIAICLGYSASYIFAIFAGAVNNDTYSVYSWRLGLGSAASLALVTCFAFMPRFRKFSVPLLLALTIFHLLMESRSLAAITFAVTIYAAATQFWPRHQPTTFRNSSIPAAILATVITTFIGLQGFMLLANAELMPESLIAKNQLQAGNSFGLLAAARPDTFTALYAISKRPILGYGSGVLDPDVYAYYAEVNAASYHNTHQSEAVYKHILANDWALGIPSHSHLFGAWADAGIFAAISWMFVIALDLKMLVRVWRWEHPMAFLFALIGVMNLWDITFSPGPVRMDMAVRLIIMAMAFRSLNFADARKIN